MRKLVVAIGFLLALATAASAQGFGVNPYDRPVSGYVRQNGTYVQPSRQTVPNHTQYDNFSAKGNINPYTGKRGTKMPRY